MGLLNTSLFTNDTIDVFQSRHCIGITIIMAPHPSVALKMELIYDVPQVAHCCCCMTVRCPLGIHCKWAKVTSIIIKEKLHVLGIALTQPIHDMSVNLAYTLNPKQLRK